MRQRLWMGFILACSTASIAAQSGTNPPAQKTDRPRTLTLTGCVAGGATPDELTFSDLSADGKPTAYRVSGTDLHSYLGRRVEITGGIVGAKLKITGGLVPSPNTAAQAGAIDPARAAMAGAGGIGAGTGTELPEFRVRRVKPVAGTCPPQK